MSKTIGIVKKGLEENYDKSTCIYDFSVTTEACYQPKSWNSTGSYHVFTNLLLLFS